MVHHVPVAPEHAAPGILLLDQGLQVALGQEGTPAGLVRLRPAAGLGGAGDGGLQGDVPFFPAQGQYGFRKIEVAASGHAADKMPHPAVIGGLHRVADLLFQRSAAGVRFIGPPGKLLRPVAGKTAGIGSSVHCDRSSLFLTLIIEQNFWFVKGGRQIFEEAL